MLNEPGIAADIQATVRNLASTRRAERAAQNLNELARRLTETVAQDQLS